MQRKIFKIPYQKPIGSLYVVRNFGKVIEARDIKHMTKELYEFLHLHCDFIAHFDINGFKYTYSTPEKFSDVFIRHFDPEHKYFHGIPRCHEVPYKETDFTKAEIIKEFNRIVDIHKQSIITWAGTKQKNQRYVLYLALKQEFEPRRYSYVE